MLGNGYVYHQSSWVSHGNVGSPPTCTVKWTGKSSEKSNGSVYSKHAHPPGICRAFVILPVLVVGICQENASFLFQYFTKNIKNIFDTYALKRYAWFSLHHFPTTQLFLHPSKKLLPPIVICWPWRKTINVLFEKFKRK